MYMETMKRFVAVVVCMLVALPAGSTTKESSPFADGSGMSVVTDNDTGCEYIHSIDGGLYPRTSPDGFSQKGCNYNDASNSEICIIRLPKGEKVSGNMGAGATHEILPGTSLSEGCFPQSED